MGRRAKSHTYRGVEYKSGLEKRVAEMLHGAKGRHTGALPGKGRFKFGYETEAITYTMPERNYWPDFIVDKPDGTKLYIEVKGYLDNDSQRKMRAVKACNPDLNIVFFFGRDNPIRKGAKMRYSDWCDKHGFDYSIGELKKEWFE